MEIDDQRSNDACAGEQLMGEDDENEQKGKMLQMIQTLAAPGLFLLLSPWQRLRNLQAQVSEGPKLFGFRVAADSTDVVVYLSGHHWSIFDFVPSGLQGRERECTNPGQIRSFAAGDKPWVLTPS